MKIKYLFVFLIITLLTAASCRGSTETPTATPTDKPTAPVQDNDEKPNIPVDKEIIMELCNDNNIFAVELYQTLIKLTEGNFFYSPYSISLALAMTYSGARGETERQMADVMHFNLPQEQLHQAFSELCRELNHLDDKKLSKEEMIFTLNIANSIWGQEGYSFKPDFVNLLSESYEAGLRLLDFVGEPEKSRQEINDWVSEETEEKIKNLIPPGAIDHLTRMVLANAIYFYADWLFPFEAESTHDRDFTLSNGEKVPVPMMWQEEYFEYGEGNGYQIIQLPYKGDRISMVILLPAVDQYKDFEESLNVENITGMLSNLVIKKVELSMPKFTFESEFSLAETLVSMGMRDAFSLGAADFSGMDGTHELYISEVFHKAFVAVDEKGTEAAAATAVIMRGKAIPMEEETVAFNADHPFMFLIRDTETGSILFLGRVMDPR